jgi:small-conductance mechanosensitive channel
MQRLASHNGYMRANTLRVRVERGGRPLLLRLVLGLSLSLMAPTAVLADAPEPAASAARVSSDAVLELNSRRIASFRATLLGDTPTERVTLARNAVQEVLDQGGPGQVRRVPAGDALRFEIDGAPVFFLVPEDTRGARGANLLEVLGPDVERRLQMAVKEARERSDPRLIAIAAAYSLGASALAYTLARLILAARHRVLAGLGQRLEGWRQRLPGAKLLAGYAEHAQTGLQFAVTALGWVLLLLLFDLWLTFVLRQFAYTRPWGERSTAWLLEVLQQFALAAVGAVPGLLTAGLIFVIARLVARANSLFLQRVERGELQLGWLDRDTADPTRRLGNVLIWLFALAMAYPFLPGANSEAFKGVSVLAGLMLSLGASSVVGQAMSGLSLMYSRALRRGEYVKIGETEGTVTELGLFATKVHTGMGEEVCLPNSVVFSQPVRNFSRLVPDGQFVMHTAVTIGYATPWRQVHAMLLEAARRTPSVATEPAPYVVQTALSDFYVEYRLCAQSCNQAPRRRAQAMNELHGHVQDVFNENGVQIMSPHYMADPPEPQIAPTGAGSGDGRQR